MKQEHIDICEKYLNRWHMLRDTKTISGITVQIVDELIKVYKEHNKGKESFCRWCPDSIVSLVKQVYLAYERDAPKPVIETVLEVKVERPNGVKPTPIAVTFDSILPKTEKPKRRNQWSK